uniref:Neurobeachin-like protein 2 n=1 Tax=Podarcis muralis TaxID=64176 RepID=A0A670JUE8_PODMU
IDKDLAYLQQWLEAFVANFEKIITVHSMEPRRPEDSVSEIPLLPCDVLQTLTQQLTSCLNQALLLIKFFIIICRNLENVQTDRPPVFIHEVTSLLSAYSKKGQNLRYRSQLENVTLYVLHLYECLFDPYQTWRRQLSGEIVSMKEKSKYKFAPAVLPQEFNSFFQGKYFSFALSPPSRLSQAQALKAGLACFSQQQNALLVVTPSSVEVLMLVLRRWCSPVSGPPRDSKLLQLTLKGLVGMVHVLHASSPDQRQVEIRAILDSYFKVLNSDQPMASLEGSPGPHWEERLIALRVNMLDAIPEMLNCDDRPVLQALFLSNNCFEHIIRLIQNSKVFDNNSDAIPIHAIGVLTSIMSNSPSAKEVFKERIGYSHLYEVLKSQSQPTKKLLQELLNMAVEGDHSSSPARLIHNEQPLLILIMWIPELKSRDLQIFLSEWLKKICNASLQSRTTCVKAGMVSCLLDALCATGQELDPKCSENLLYLLQVLGGLSIRPGELRQLLKLLRTEQGKGPHPYTVQVIRALSGMARKDGAERALQYFDLTPSMAGIMVPSIQKWPGSGFAFHAWVCLVEEAKDFPEEAARLKRKQLYSFFTTNGTGFEAFFTADGTLVVAVCTKKEYMTVALQEFPFNDAAWVSKRLGQTWLGFIGVNVRYVAAEGHNFLLHLLYQFLLFDFRIWSNSDFAVRLGHIQYLSNVIKDHKQRIRRKYGVQYILDSIRTYYGTYKEKPIATDDIKTVQTSLFSLIKEFFCRNFSTEEMQSTLNYLAAVNDEHQVCGVLEVIHSLLKSSPSQEQIYTFLFEPGNVEIFFSLLVQRKFSDEVRERIFKILYKMLKYEKVNERSKQRLKLKDVGFLGFISGEEPLSTLLFPFPPTKTVFCCLAFSPDTPNYKDLLAVIYLSHRAELTVRLDICRELFRLIYKPQDPAKQTVRQLAKLAGWQDTLTKLYVKESYESRQHSLSGSANGGGSLDLPKASDHRSSSSNTIDPPGATEAPQAGDTLPADRVYHPLSPFSMSPFDLGLDLGSTSSAATAESGDQTPVSLPGTPSPLENFKPFPGTRVRKSSSLSNVLDDTSYQDTLPSDSISNTSNPQQTPEEELCNLLTNIVFSVTWRGVEGWDDAAWKERGQVFSVLTKLGSACELVRQPDEIKRSLLEMMMESALTDIKEATLAMLPSLTQNALKLLRLLQDFLFSEGHSNQALWSEKVYEGVNSLLDKLGVWHHLANGTSDLKEMAQIGLRVLIGYISLEDLQLQSMAYVKLHSLLQTASAPKKEEACYVLGKLETPLRHSLHTKSETFSWLVPIIRTLMDKCYDTLRLQHFLPSLPPTNGSPTFYEDFQEFCTTPEWIAFIEKHVQPTMAQFEVDTFAKSHDHMSNFWNSCYDALMSSSQTREKEKAESRRRFQELILEPVMKKAKHENIRHTNMLKQLNNHQNTVLKQWKALRRLLTSQRSAWADRNPPEIHWKLSCAETYSRMRLKLVPNYNFDRHTEASALRDNQGADYLHNPAEPIPLAVAKEAKVSEMQDDQLAEEDLSFLDNLVEPKEQSQREKLVISEDCELITIVAVIPGRLEVTTQHIYFYDSSCEKDETEEGIGYDFKRPLSQLRELHLRRYNLRRSALEFFFIDQANYFLNFKKKVRNKVYSSILGLRPPNQIYFASRSPQDLLKASGLTQKWVNREISNFEYLMQLNTIAGRTYNDLSQYPVFPWILQDYISETLDLNNPAVFRDLSKPIGVANERHAKDVKEKYESFEDPTGMIDKFHYGTHYSNAAGVMHYLIRTEPFTTLHIQLQSGRFDCSDRQFHSVPAAWQARMENPVDVKELIPEFFYFTDFLENQNSFDLGSLQMSNEKVGDVVLPRWAKSPEDFIHKHRKALESEYVSAHLHEWIDLIFGYKQRGPAAVEALNVFYYCTYEGAVDLDAIADETQRKALEGIISNFGQTPCQLLKEPHPARLSAENAASKRVSRLDTIPPNVFENLSELKSFFAESISDGIPLVQAVVPKNQAHSFMTQGYPDMLVTVSANGLLGTHGWLPYDKNISNYFSFTKDPTVSNAKTQRFLYGPVAPGVEVSSKTLTVSHDGKLLFSGGHWDNSLRVTSLSRGKVVGHINRHIDVVTCLALDLCGIYLISGSRDTTCMVWQVLQQGGFSCGLAPKPVQVLYGHDDEVTCVAISTELDMAVSGSKDGTVIVHTIRRGQFMQSLRPPCESSLPVTVSNLTMGHEGQVVVQTTVEGRFALHLYSVNGKHLVSIPLDEQVTAMCVTEEFVVLGTVQCSLQIRDLQSLQAAVAPLAMKVPIHSVSVTKEKSHILVGLEDGKLIVVGAGQPLEVKSGQFHRRLWRSTRRISQVSSGETEYNPAESK